MARHISSGWHVVIIAIGFAILGGWLSLRLVGRPAQYKNFEQNDAAIASLGLTQRECDVLAKLSDGDSYKEIARSLSLSPNTVKTHVSNIYKKLDTDRRTHAIKKAQLLSIIP